MAVELEGKVAFITGGARGIGFDIAERLVRAGESVFICGRDPSSLESALGRLRNIDLYRYPGRARQPNRDPPIAASTKEIGEQDD